MSVLLQTPLPEVSALPINGVGGSYYNVPFDVPTYNPNDPDVYNQTTWRQIDRWAESNFNILITQSIGLGLCLATVAYVLALTPARKRGLPFHSLLFLALFFQIFRSLCDLIQAPTAGMSQFSAYNFLTNDLTATSYSTGYRTLRIMALFAASLALLFSLTCLYLQSQGLLSGLQVKRPNVYKPVMLYLVIVSVIAQMWSFIYAIFGTSRVINSLGRTGEDIQSTLSYGMLVMITVSIGSWSFVSLISTTSLIMTRSKLLLSRNSLYDSALNLIALICLESFIVPLLFCILQLVPPIVGLLQPELIVIPSVLVLLPLGSLFMTVNNADSKAIPANISNSDSSRQPLAPTRRMPSVCPTEPQTPRTVVTATDRELQLIDALEETEGTVDDEQIGVAKFDHTEGKRVAETV